jgi:hypothetical protein
MGGKVRDGYHLDYDAANREKLRAYRREWARNARETGNLRELERERMKPWRQANPGADSAQYHSDEQFRLRMRLRAILRHAIVNVAARTRCFDRWNTRSLIGPLLGCSPRELKAHFEKLFQPKMSWENYGSEWEIDHIRPVASFDLTDPDQQAACFHYTNLRPLWRTDNQRRRRIV